MNPKSLVERLLRLRCGNMGFYSETSCCILPLGHDGNHSYGKRPAQPTALELEAAAEIERLTALQSSLTPATESIEAWAERMGKALAERDGTDAVAANCSTASQSERELVIKDVSIAGPQAAELLKAWREAGGSHHGPHVETASMPVANLLPFLTALQSERGKVIEECGAAREEAVVIEKCVSVVRGLLIAGNVCNALCGRMYALLPAGRTGRCPNHCQCCLRVGALSLPPESQQPRSGELSGEEQPQ